MLCYRNHTKSPLLCRNRSHIWYGFCANTKAIWYRVNITKVKGIKQRHADLFPVVIACVAWWFWLGTLSNKGGRGKRNHEEIGAGATSWLCRSFLRTSHMNFVASPLMRPAQQNRHATQATVVTFIFSPPNWREATTANTTATELGDYSKI